MILSGLDFEKFKIIQSAMSLILRSKEKMKVLNDLLEFSETKKNIRTSNELSRTTDNNILQIFLEKGFVETSNQV